MMVEYKRYDEAREAVERGEVEAFATIDVLLAAQRAKSKDPSKLAIVGAYLVLEPIAIFCARAMSNTRRSSIAIWQR